MSNRRMLSVLSCVVAMSALALLSGCAAGGPETGNVEGTVTLDGEPLADAEVVFQPADGAPSTGTTDGSGHYSLMFTRDKPGALIGEHKVKITTITTDSEGNPLDEAVTVPAQYNAETVLTANVKAGDNTFNFELESEGEAPEESPAE